MPDSQILYINADGKALEIVKEDYPDGFPVANNYSDSVLTGPAGYSALVVRPSDVNMLMKALWFADAAKWRGYYIHTLILPYLPGARQDRLNPQGDFLFAAKSIADEINARGFSRVICFDPHSDVMPALINRCHVVHVDEVDIDFGTNCYDGVVAPDAGAAKRAERIAKKLKIPVFNAWKTRDIASGNSKITGFGIEEISGVQRLLIVDDICDGGGTFTGLGNHIKTIGQSYEIELDLYVSHGLFTKGVEHLGKVFKKIITTDSTEGRYTETIPEWGQNAKVVISPVVDQLIEEGRELA